MVGKNLKTICFEVFQNVILKGSTTLVVQTLGEGWPDG